MRRLLLTIAFVVLCGCGVRATLAEDVTVIHAARLLDVKAGRLISPAVVVVKGERIEGVGAAAAPSGARTIELGDVTVLPGLIDCHTHLMGDIQWDEYGTTLLTKSQAYRALEGAAHARRMLHAGFTTVSDEGNEGSGYADVALRDAINAGLIEGPRLQVATRAIAALGQYQPFGVSPDLPDFPRGVQMVSGTDSVRRAVREGLTFKEMAGVLKLSMARLPALLAD